jgi:septal ring factor EnvC (AmiA/AmiB activator)
VTCVSGSLQTELVQAAVDRGSLEQELAANRLAVERVERDGRQEASRLQAEVAALRQRLDRADADLMHSRRENLRLTEQIASLEREVCLDYKQRVSIEPENFVTLFEMLYQKCQRRLRLCYVKMFLTCFDIWSRNLNMD